MSMHKALLSETKQSSTGVNGTPPAFEVIAVVFQAVTGKPRCNVMKREASIDALNSTMFADPSAMYKNTAAIALSPDGMYLLRSGVANTDGSEIYVYNASTEKYNLLKTLVSSVGNCYGQAVAFHPNGGYFAIFSGNNVVLFKSNGGAWDEIDAKAFTVSTCKGMHFVKTDNAVMLRIITENTPVAPSTLGNFRLVTIRYINDVYIDTENTPRETYNSASYPKLTVTSTRGFYDGVSDVSIEVYNRQLSFNGVSNLKFDLKKTAVASDGTVTNTDTSILSPSLSFVSPVAVSCSAFIDKNGRKCIAVVLGDSTSRRNTIIYALSNDLTSIIEHYYPLPLDFTNIGLSDSAFLATQNTDKHYIISGKRQGAINYKSKTYTIGYDANDQLVSQLSPNDLIFNNDDMFLSVTYTKNNVSIYPWGYYL